MQELTINNLDIAYGEKVIFKDFNIQFQKGKINVILGSSGVGKSSLFNAISGLIPYQGNIDIDKSKLSYIFQKSRLIPTISVYKNLDLVLKSVFADKKERKKRIVDMLEKLEIADQISKLPTALSGGQAQRVSIARALLYNGDVLLLDEPFKEVDTALKSKLLNLLTEYNENENKTIIYITHAIDECLLVADSYFLLKGSPACVIYSGTINTVKSVRSIKDDDLDLVRRELLNAIY